MSDPVEVLALAPYPERAPSTRWRLAHLREGLLREGVRLVVRPFLDGPAWAAVRRGGALAGVALARSVGRLRHTLASVADHDAVLVQRGVAPLLDEWVARTLDDSPRPLLYDFDDAVYLPQEGGRGWLEGLRRPEATTAAYCRAADAVLAGNETLAAFAREARGTGGDGAVSVIPTVVDTDRFRPREGDGAGEAQPVLGWVGSDTGVAYLEELAPALRAIQDRTGCRVRVVSGSRRPRLDGVEHEWVGWRPADEVRVFQELDVGLYPLEDTPWSRGKCGFKAVQYLACGVPCVASPVGVLEQLVRPGETGLHATTPDEWIEACTTLLTDAGARRRMGAAGRAEVERAWSVAAVVPRIAGVVRSVVAG